MHFKAKLVLTSAQLCQGNIGQSFPSLSEF